jgi:hypothetical protein
VRDAVEAGKLKGNEKLPAKMVLTIGGVSLSHEFQTRSSSVSAHNCHRPRRRAIQYSREIGF